MIQWSRPLLALTLLLAIVGSVVWSESPTNPENVDRESLTDLIVELKDDAGKPIAGAAVMVYAMRMKEQPGHGYWNAEKLGPPKSAFSDDKGIAIVKYPAKVYRAPDAMTTRLVTFSIRHTDFVTKTVHFELALKKAEIELKTGCEIQLSATNPSGEMVSDFAVMMAGRYRPDFWADDGNGGRRTSAASDGTWQTMLVKPQADGVTLFSAVLPLRVRPSQAVRIRNLRLKPGVRVLGKLSDDVPRPVKNGYVVTVTAPKPEGDSWSEESPSLTWTQWEPIAEDGTFELKSIPRSGELQVIALSDGWLSKTTIPENRVFVMGQLFPISEEKEMEVTVEMERTGILEVMVEKPDGTPLSGGKISSWPNQKYYKGGSTLLGARYNSMAMLVNQLRPPAEEKRPNFRDYSYIPYSGQDIENGKVVLRGLPVGRSDSIVLSHPEYVLDTDERFGISFTLESEKPKRIVVKAKPTKKATTP